MSTRSHRIYKGAGRMSPARYSLTRSYLFFYMIAQKCCNSCQRPMVSSSTMGIMELGSLYCVHRDYPLSLCLPIPTDKCHIQKLLSSLFAFRVAEYTRRNTRYSLRLCFTSKEFSDSKPTRKQSICLKSKDKSCSLYHRWRYRACSCS